MAVVRNATHRYFYPPPHARVEDVDIRGGISQAVKLRALWNVNCWPVPGRPAGIPRSQLHTLVFRLLMCYQKRARYVASHKHSLNSLLNTSSIAGLDHSEFSPWNNPSTLFSWNATEIGFVYNKKHASVGIFLRSVVSRWASICSDQGSSTDCSRNSWYKCCM